MKSKLEKVKNDNIKNNIPIIMDETLKKIYETIGENKLDNILEIGTAQGYSSICFTKLLSENGKIDTIERNEDNIKKARKNISKLNLNKKINIIEGEATEALLNINKIYDMIFIDAAKSKYPFFLEQAIRLTKKGSVIFADNVLFKGYVLSDYNKHKQRTAVNALRTFIKYASENHELKTEILTIGDGLSISYRI